MVMTMAMAKYFYVCMYMGQKKKETKKWFCSRSDLCFQFCLLYLLLVLPSFFFFCSMFSTYYLFIAA